MSAEWYYLVYSNCDEEQARALFWLRFFRDPAECEYDPGERCWWLGPVSTKEKRQAINRIEVRA